MDRDARSVLIIPQVAGAGLLAGDHFRQTISVAPGAALKLVSAGATLVHGAPSPRASTSSWRYRLGASAKAVIVQEPHVLMQGADLTLCQDLVLHEDAIFIAGDIFAFADGVTSAAWAAQTSVSRPDGTIVFTDRTKASGQDLVRTARLPGSVAAFATVLVLAPKAFVPELMRALERPIASLDPRLWGPVPRFGVMRASGSDWRRQRVGSCGTLCSS